LTAITCDICGGNLSMDASGDFAVCESCGMKHTKDRVKAKALEVTEAAADGNNNVSNAEQAAENTIIPTKFTDIALNQKKTDLIKTIYNEEENIKELERKLDRAEDRIREIERNARIHSNEVRQFNIKQDREKQDARFIANLTGREKDRLRSDRMELWGTGSSPLLSNTSNYIQNKANARNDVSSLSDSIKTAKCQLAAYREELNNIDDLLQKTPVQRVKDHYQSLIDEMRANVANISKLTELVKKFREMEGYKDTEALANECEYSQLAATMNKASTENDYNDLAKRFREMNGYKDTAELAKECKNKAPEARYNQLVLEKKILQTNKEYKNIKEWFRENYEKYKDLAKRFREMNGYKDTAELAKECESRSVEARYNQLILEKTELQTKQGYQYTEQSYQWIAVRFQEINGYKDAAELARECDNQYRAHKERREEQERTEREHLAKQERISRRHKTIDKFWTFIISVTSGPVAGYLVYCISMGIGGDTGGPIKISKIPVWPTALGMALWIVFLVIWRRVVNARGAEDRHYFMPTFGGCWGGGCLGFIILIGSGTFLYGNVHFAAIAIGLFISALTWHLLKKD